MIYETLQILKEQLEKYFTEIGLEKIIALDNIALWGSGDNNDEKKVEGKVVLSLLKIEEETTLKNTPHFEVKDNKTAYKNQPVNLNLYLLISANCDTYDKSLRSISKIIEYFQGKKVFTSTNTVYNRNNVAFEELNYFRFNLELFSPSFEEQNHIWGTLGGRQLPSVIYKIQLVQIDKDKKLASSEVITHIGGNLNDLQQ
ncbi:Protein of unknown function [Tangfeifania diversioriginum]|uniref:Pvc16 N-terminal domain-containing protein n=1 Tax=Tangfeifania diversioriginum TaxID=1168035 RepID=A0A1M6CNE5_9BACT|nr:DUF4255 domain-containing protein [Tangfeifania diversioriginum]SHI62314.1 Protein of unknown function [Tangfeifania diversioriginum]